MRHFLRTYWGLLLVIALNIGVHHTWVFGFHYLTSGDAGVWLPSTQKELVQNALSIQTTNSGLGGPSITGSYDLIEFLYGALAHLGVTYPIALRLLLLWPYLILTPIAAYVILSKLFTSRAAVILGSLVVLFNTYTLTIQQGHLLVLFADTLMVFFLYYTYRFCFEEYSWKNFYKLVGVGIIFSAYEFRIFYIGMAVAGLLVVYQSITSRQYKGLVYFGAATVILGLVNLPWLLGLSATGSLTRNGLFDRGLFGSQYFDLQSAFTLFHRFWTGGKIVPFSEQPIPIYFWLLPIFASLGLYLNRRSRPVMFFGLVAVIGILLTKQADAPFPTLYEWLYNHLPGFNAFREASKFYFLIALSYAVLIAGCVDWLWHNWRRTQLQRGMTYAAAYGIAGLFLWNCTPLVTGSIGTMFVPRHMPADYKVIEDFLQKQPEYFRTYWLPKESRWAPYTNNHPMLDAADLANGDWSTYLNNGQEGSRGMEQDRLVTLFKEPYGEHLLSSASVKYVIIPLRDTANDDDFFHYYGDSREFFIKAAANSGYLKRIDIGTKDVVVYENTHFRPHFAIAADPVALDDFGNIAQSANFLRNIGRGTADVLEDKAGILGLSRFKPLFNPPWLTSQNGGTALTDTFTNATSASGTLYRNNASLDLKYRADANTASIYAQPVEAVSYNRTTVPWQNATPNLLATVNLASDHRHYLVSDGLVTPLFSGSSGKVGAVTSYKQAAIYADTPNILTNGSFEKGLWERQVQDCNNYDAQGRVSMSLEKKDVSDGHQALQLEATRHIACTSTTVAVKGNTKYLFSLDYQSPNSRLGGYYIAFNNRARTIVQDQFGISVPNQWQKQLRAIDVPPGATTASISLYAYESDRKRDNIIRYDNVTLRQLTLEKPLDIPHVADSFQAAPLQVAAGTATLSLPVTGYSSGNLINNPSFEAGFWQPEVSDCNKSDDNGKVSQSLTTKNASDGHQALQLEATRHIACNNTSFELAVGGDHLLSFDYAGIGAQQGGFSLQFDDLGKTIVSERLNISGTGWKSYRKIVHVPPGATTASLTIYAYATDGHVNNIVRYDNFRFAKIEDVSNAYYLSTDARQVLISPQQLGYADINPSLHTVQARGVRGAFLVHFSESFQQGWKVYMLPANRIADCQSMAKVNSSALTSQAMVNRCPGGFGTELLKHKGFIREAPVFDDKHIELNGFANGWLIDPAYIKAHYSPEYYRQNPDGSIDFTMAVYFKPQSYFYIGLIISGLTLSGCLVVLVVLMVRRRRLPPHDEKPHPRYRLYPKK